MSTTSLIRNTPVTAPELNAGELVGRRLCIRERAESVLNGDRVRYVLGRGGRKPLSSVPWDLANRLDCSGFSSWCCGLDRYQPRSKLYVKYNGGWISTDAIVYDAKRPKEETGYFTEISYWDAEPGDLVVYGDYVVKGKDGFSLVRKQGHVGVVTDVEGAASKNFSPDERRAWFTDSLRVTHCSKSNDLKLGSAIQTTDGSIFNRPDTIFARFDP